MSEWSFLPNLNHSAKSVSSISHPKYSLSLFSHEFIGLRIPSIINSICSGLAPARAPKSACSGNSLVKISPRATMSPRCVLSVLERFARRVREIFSSLTRLAGSWAVFWSMFSYCSIFWRTMVICWRVCSTAS